MLIHPQLLATPWTADSQAPLFLEFPRQEDWSGLPFPPPSYLSNPGIEPASPALGRWNLSPHSHQGNPYLSTLRSNYTFWKSSCCSRAIISQCSQEMKTSKMEKIKKKGPQKVSHWFSILYIVLIVYMSQSQSPNSSHPPFPFGVHILVLYACASISALPVRSCVQVF